MASLSAAVSRMKGWISRVPLTIFQFACQNPSTRSVPPVAPLPHQGLEQGAEADEILGGQQVDGVAHEVGTHHGPFGQKIFELLMTEAGEPRPQTYVRSQRGLGLQAGQVPDRRPGRHRGPAQQQLALQRGAVKGDGEVGGARRLSRSEVTVKAFR
jgi:hypothetical protein